MSQVDFTPAPTFRAAPPKARMTIYFALLIIALAAMIAGCIIMYLEVGRFGGFGAEKGRISSLDRTAPTMFAAAKAALVG